MPSLLSSILNRIMASAKPMNIYMGAGVSAFPKTQWAPPFLSAGGKGGVEGEPPIKFSKMGGLTEPQLLEEDC